MLLSQWRAIIGPGTRRAPKWIFPIISSSPNLFIIIQGDMGKSGAGRGGGEQERKGDFYAKRRAGARGFFFLRVDIPHIFLVRSLFTSLSFPISVYGIITFASHFSLYLSLARCRQPKKCVWKLNQVSSLIQKGGGENPALR